MPVSGVQELFMSDSPRRKMRWWIPALIVAVFGGLTLMLFLKDNVARYFALTAALVFGILYREIFGYAPSA